MTNNGTYSVECRLRKRDGSYRWWLIRGVPHRDAQGQISKWFGTCTDIEQIKNFNQELENQTFKRTIELNETIAELEEQTRAFVGRELTMIELKEKIAKLEQQMKDK